jgi:hypothetical protein
MLSHEDETPSLLHDVKIIYFNSSLSYRTLNSLKVETILFTPSVWCSKWHKQAFNKHILIRGRPKLTMAEEL